MFFTIIQRELLLAWRKSAEIFHPLWFFLLVLTLFPLSIGPDPLILARISAGVVWVAALLSGLLALERVFRDDFIDGSLEQLMIMPQPLALLMLSKVIAHWLLTGLPLLLFTPLVGLFLSFDLQLWQTLFFTLLLGTPSLSLIGAIGVALTVGLRRGGGLLSLLLLPLYVPVLIFATAAMEAASMGLPIGGYLAILAAILIGAVMVSPIAIAAALRVAVR